MLTLDIADEPTTDDGQTSARLRIGLAVGLVVAIIAIAVVMSTDPSTRAGQQVPSMTNIVMRPAPVDGWEPLVPTAGSLRDGFPAPMVWRSSRICLGFAQAEFGPDDRRPSRARCQREALGRPLDVDEILVLHSIESGFDTWHFIEAADRVESVTVKLSTGDVLNGDRIHLSGSTIALRLENGTDVGSVGWSTRSQSFECATDPAAWRTSQFCPPTT